MVLKKMVSYPEVGLHRCKLEEGSSDFLPRLSPRASRFRRFLRVLDTCRFPSYHHRNTKYYFWSSESLKAEKLRFLYVCPKFMLHPFSIISVIIEYVMFHVWLLDMLHHNMMVSYHLQELRIFSALLRSSRVVYIITRFFTGYATDSEVILKLKLVIIHYAKTYMVFDLAITVVIPMLPTILDDYTRLFLILLLKMGRLLTFHQYSLTVYKLYGCSKHISTLTNAILFMITYLHVFSCLLNSLFDNSEGNKMMEATFQIRRDNISFARLYAFNFNLMVKIFTRASPQLAPIDREAFKIFSFMLIIITTMMIQIFIVAYVIDWTKRVYRSNTKYMYVLQELQDFIESRDLPPRLKMIALNYYKQKFNHKHFKDAVINSFLTEHLRYEIFLYTCTPILNRSPIFQGMHKLIIGQIISNLQPEFVLPNDVIITAGEEFHSMFFISYGTVAIYYEGVEMKHLEDGDFMGFNGYKRGTYIATTIAVERTEVFRWKRKDLEQCIAMYPDLGARFDELNEEWTLSMNAGRTQNELKMSAIIRNLKDGKILERPEKL